MIRLPISRLWTLTTLQIGKIGRILGAMLDAEDRQVLTRVTIWIVASIITLIVLAGAAGIALAVFEAARGL